jgi:hypothetical protein
LTLVIWPGDEPAIVADHKRSGSGDFVEVSLPAQPDPGDITAGP